MFFTTIKIQKAKYFVVYFEGLPMKSDPLFPLSSPNEGWHVYDFCFLLFFSPNVDTKHGLYEKKMVYNKRKQFRSVQFKNTNEFSIKISLPKLPCLLSFLPCVVERDFSEF